MFEGRCADLGLEASRLLLLLYDQLVDSTLSYAAATWAPGLAAAAIQQGVTGGVLSEAEKQHAATLRRLLGLLVGLRGSWLGSLLLTWCACLEWVS